jgi:hypothetical protein
LKNKQKVEGISKRRKKKNSKKNCEEKQNKRSPKFGTLTAINKTFFWRSFRLRVKMRGIG